MIIESKLMRDVKINFSNKEIYFDKKGEAKVSDEIGEAILLNFPNNYWEKGKKPAEPVKPKAEETNFEALRLREEVLKLKVTIEGLKKEVQSAKEAEETWRNAYEELDQKLKKNPEDLNVDPNAGGEDHDIGTGGDEDLEFVVPAGMEEYYEQMKGMQFMSLKKWVKENFNKTDEELKELNNKELLMGFVFENITK